MALAFQATNSTADIHSGGSFTIGDSGDDKYKHIKVENNGTLTFPTAYSTYLITKLEVKDDAVINFVPGDYYIKELKTDGKNMVINVLGSGTVRIWSTREVKFKKSALVNSPSAGTAGTPSSLLIHTTEKLKVEGGSTEAADEQPGADEQRQRHGDQRCVKCLWFPDLQQENKDQGKLCCDQRPK